MIRRTAAAAALALLLVGACTDDDDGAPPDPDPTREGDTTGGRLDPDAPAPAADLPGAQLGGGITVLSSDSGPRTFDPTRASSLDTIAILQLVSRSLTQYRYDPQTDRSVLVPDLATDLGRHNRDFTEWSFTLRRGLRYADGSPVSARHVAYAVERAANVERPPSAAPYNRLPFVDDVDVRGREVTIELVRPLIDLPYVAALPAFTAIPRTADRPLATGPYQVESFRPGDRLVLSRNPYWGARTDPARHAYVDGWTFEWGVDATRRDTVLVQDVAAGQTTASYDDVLADTYAVVRQDEDLEQRMVTGRSPCTYAWQLDTDEIASLVVRRAIGYAYPYREAWRAGGLVEAVTRLPATSLLPPGSAGRVDYDVLGIEGANTDPDRARELLARVGKLGYEVSFSYQADDPTSVAVKDARVAGLERAGFTAVPVPTTGVGGQSADPRAAVNVREVTWCADWPTADSWFLRRLAAESALVDQPGVERRIDELLDRQSEPAARTGWGRLDRFLQTDTYPAVTLGYAGRASLHGSRIGGMAIDEVYGMPTYANMHVLPVAEDEE
ncbi:MAG: ABC transporter substrate-binding protein [Actinomycetota bacterium]|nr:ABC transporter substrate-binding protein [Actinomycetota bacterium]